jgi:hypothetical protein
MLDGTDTVYNYATPVSVASKDRAPIEASTHRTTYFFQKSGTINYYYMASITSGEMADRDWLRSTFSGPLFSRNEPAVHCVKPNACILKQNSKTN